MAQSGHPNAVDECPLSGVKRASITARHQRRAPVTVASSAFISCCGSAARITPPITAMPAGDMRRSSDLRKPFAANLGTIARFARSLERRSRDRIIENARIDRLGFGDGVDRHADELVGS